MIELKIYCDCGQKYKFDVEPVNNQMPFTVACPICKRDGTAKANAQLQQMSVFKKVEPPSAPAPVAAAPVRVAVTPSPISPPPIANAPVAPPPAPQVRIAASAASAPPPLSANPRPIAPIKPVSATTEIPMTWYQYIWIGVPLILIAIGGCLGGACGGGACAINRTVFMKTSNPVMKYVWTGAISAAAFLIYFILVGFLLGLLHGLGGDRSPS